jgi:hypothetical protein
MPTIAASLARALRERELAEARGDGAIVRLLDQAIEQLRRAVAEEEAAQAAAAKSVPAPRDGGSRGAGTGDLSPTPRIGGTPSGDQSQTH